MLRKRSIATASDQASMSDYGSLPSPTDKYRSIASSFFSSPRLFAGFTSKGFITDTESIMSPTSTLDSRGLSSFKNPFWSDTPTPKTPKPESRNLWEKLDSRCVGLGLIDALADDKDKNFSKSETRMVLFGSQLKIQIPPLPPSVLLSPSDSPKSPKDFGIKTRNFQLGSFSTYLSPSPVKKIPFGSSNSGMENLNSPRVFHGCLSASEKDSEDYTCVITYGPNPKTTHIFEDCIVESCPGVVGLSASRKENELFTNRSRNYPPENFLSFCFKCKKNLDQGKDVYMYMGDKAFCSNECRYKEMMLEEGMEKLESDDVYGFSS